MATEKFDSAARIRDIILPTKTLTRYAASGEQLRDDPLCREYLLRTLDYYRKLISLEDGDATKEKRTWEAVSFVETVCDLYTDGADPMMASETAGAAIDFMRSLESEYLGAPYVSYYRGYAEMLVAECSFRCSSVSEEGLSHIAEAKRAYTAALDFNGKFNEIYATAPALADTAVAHAYTEDGMHREAIPYRELAIAALEAIIKSGEEITHTVHDLANAERVKLALNKIFTTEAGKDSPADADMLIFALGALCKSYKEHKSSAAQNVIPLGYICAGLYAARLKTKELEENVAKLRDDISELGLLSGIGGKYEEAHRARATAEIYEKQGADSDTVAEAYLAAIAEYKKHTDIKDIAEARTSVAECYGAICSVYMAEENWQEAKKYAALELNERRELLNEFFAAEAISATAESYYKYAVLLELQDDEDADTDERRDAVCGFYLSALKLAVEGMADDPTGAAAETVSGATEQLLGIIMDNYNATVELSDTEEDGNEADSDYNGETGEQADDSETAKDELIAKYASRGIKLCQNLLPYLSPDVAAGVTNMMAYFKAL